jgi:hypothetical protein
MTAGLLRLQLVSANPIPPTARELQLQLILMLTKAWRAWAYAFALQGLIVSAANATLAYDSTSGWYCMGRNVVCWRRLPLLAVLSSRPFSLLQHFIWWKNRFGDLWPNCISTDYSLLKIHQESKVSFEDSLLRLAHAAPFLLLCILGMVAHIPEGEDPRINFDGVFGACP